MEWIDIFNTLGLTGFVSTIAIFLIKRHYDKVDKREEKDDTVKEQLDSINDKLLIYDSDLEKINNLIETLLEGEQALLRQTIIQVYNHYCRDKQYFPIYARESFDHMYKAYKQLDGNGVIDDLVNELNSLSTEPSKE